MKQLICEMCGSNDLLKQDGVFVCQDCGTKYSVDEAKKMMAGGSVEASGTVKVDQSHLIKDFLNIAKSAIDSGNNAEAEQYCNKVIEMDPCNYNAFLYKGTSTAWQSTFANIRIPETINCWKKAFANCDEEKRNGFFSYTDAEFEKIVVAMVNLAGNFVENGITDYKVNSYEEHLHSILNCVVLYKKTINSAFCEDDICCKAAISVIPSLMKCAQSQERLYHKIKPSGGESYRDFITEYLGCITILDMTAVFGQKDEAKALCYEKAAEVMQTINDLPFYVWFDGRYQPRKNTTNSYGSTIALYKEKANEARKQIAKKIEEENKKNRDKFWSIYSDEYRFLKEELKKSEVERSKLKKADAGYTKISLLDEHISIIEEILKKNRTTTSQILKSEQDFIKKCEAFWLELSSNNEYDSYLDQNPILKQTNSLAEKRESLIEQNKEIKQLKGPDADGWGGLSTYGLLVFGSFGAIIGLMSQTSFFIVLGVLGIVCGGIRLLNIMANVRNMEESYKKDVIEYNATIDKMHAVPKYTGKTPKGAEIEIPQKIEIDN